jgi:hypothetical protein
MCSSLPQAGRTLNEDAGQSGLVRHVAAAVEAHDVEGEVGIEACGMVGAQNLAGICCSVEQLPPCSCVLHGFSTISDNIWCAA